MADSTMAAFGIGVSDLRRSADFYTKVLGMTEMQTYKLPHMDEIIVGYPKSAAVALMHWTDGSNPSYRDLPIKLVFTVADAAVITARVREAGYEVVSEPVLMAAFGNMTIGFAKDPDGYLIELLQPPAS